MRAAPNSPREDGCVEVSAWLFAEDAVQARRSFLRASEIVDYYTELIGPYAFEKLAHVQSATLFGGMENASAIFYSEKRLASREGIEDIVAHETAHQWFGAQITEADWPELWLSEGFATYFGMLFFERADGEDAFRRRLEQARQEYLSSKLTGRPVIEAQAQDLFELLNVNNYEKAAWVLHMLRAIVGDDAFFDGIRSYYERYAGRNATTDEFRRVMEEAANRDLTWFFEQWLLRPGHPVLNAAWTWDAAANEVVVSITQAQSDDWPVFRLPMEISVEAASRNFESHSVEMLERVQRFRFPVTQSRAT